MDKKMKQEFWKDFVIPTQEESEEVAFANPSDVARSLVKARNWYATVSSSLSEAIKERDLAVEMVQALDSEQTLAENLIIAKAAQGSSLSTSVVKSKQTITIHAIGLADEVGRTALREIDEYRVDAVSQRNDWNTRVKELENMRRAIEKTTEWLIQYINWYKFELREKI